MMTMELSLTRSLRWQMTIVPMCVRMRGQSPGGQWTFGGTPGHSFINLVNEQMPRVKPSYVRTWCHMIATTSVLWCHFQGHECNQGLLYGQSQYWLAASVLLFISAITVFTTLQNYHSFANPYFHVFSANFSLCHWDYLLGNLIGSTAWWSLRNADCMYQTVFLCIILEVIYTPDEVWGRD